MEREQAGPPVGVAPDRLAADVDRRHRRAARLEGYRRPQRLAPRTEGLQVNISDRVVLRQEPLRGDAPGTVREREDDDVGARRLRAEVLARLHWIERGAGRLDYLGHLPVGQVFSFFLDDPCNKPVRPTDVEERVASTA